MKHNLVISLFAVFIVTALLSCSSADKKDQVGDGTPAKMEFDEDGFDFGTIKPGEVVSHVFKFKNVGGTELILSSVTTSCGCAATKWDKTPILPGKESQIEVTFDSAGKEGSQYKTVTILANSEPRKKEVSIKAWIKVEVPK